MNTRGMTDKKSHGTEQAAQINRNANLNSALKHHQERNDRILYKLWLPLIQKSLVPGAGLRKGRVKK